MRNSADKERHNVSASQIQAMATLGKQETLEIFTELLERFWERLVMLIGETATVAVFRSALIETSREYPLLRDIEIHPQGMNLQKLKQHLESEESPLMRSGLVAFTDSLMTLLIDLTGGILLSKLEPLVEQFKQKLEEEQK